jgi:hypothetical protein
VQAIVFLVAVASLFPPSLFEQMMTALAAFAPGDVVSILREQLSRSPGASTPAC